MVTKTFTVSHDGTLEGYVVLSHAQSGMEPTKVTVTDLAATTSRAAKGILRMLTPR